MADDVGVVSPPPVAPGQAAYQRLKDAGYSQQEADDWKSGETQKLLQGGFTPSEVDAHWGDTTPQSTQLDQHIKTNMGLVDPALGVKDRLDAMAAGFGMSVTGLALRGAKPDAYNPKYTDVANGVLEGLSQAAGDLPATIAGFVGGTAVGTAAGAGVPVAGETGASEAVGAVAGAGFGANALPQAMREIMLDSYNRGEVHSFRDFMTMASKSVINTMKAGTIGAVTNLVGGPVTGKVLAATGSKLVATAAGLGAQAVTATSVAGALDGHVPDRSDFVTGAATMLGLHVAGTVVAGRFKPSEANNRVTSNLQEIYKETGIPPWQAMDTAKTDPAVRDELLAQDVNGKPVIPTLRDQAAPEPEPHASAAEQIKAQINQQARSLAESDINAATSHLEAPGRFTRLAEEQENGGVQAAGKGVAGRETNPDTSAADAALGSGLARVEAAGGGGGEKPPGEVSTEVKEPEPEDRSFLLNEDMLNDKFRDMVASGEGKPNNLLDPGRNYRQWINELGPARDIDKMLKGQGITPGKDVGIEDMFRQTYASDARLGHVIYRGGIDPVTMEQTKAPPVMDAVKAVKAKGGNLADWENYMLAQRTLDKSKQGVDTGFDLEASQRLVDFGKDKYEDATRQLNASMDGVLDYARDSHYLSQEQIDAFRRDNPTYIKMRRLMGEEPEPVSRGKGFKPGAQPDKLEGSDRPVVDPLENTIDNMGLFIRNADRNRAIGAVVGMDDETRGLLGLKRIGFTNQVKATIAEPGSDLFKPYGIDNPEPYEPIVANRARRGSLEPNQFLYYRDGKPEVWETKDPNLAQLLRGADSTGEVSLVDKAISTAARIQRAGIVAAPDFPTRVILRHQVTAFIADPLHPPPFLTWGRGLMDSFGQSDRYWEWVRNGGAGASLTEMSRSYITKDMGDLFEQTDVWGKAWNAVKSPLEAVEWLQARNDAAARIGYMGQAEAQGYTPLKAATMGRQAYIDYAQKGTLQVAGMMSRWTPFFRPHLLGLDQIGGAFKQRPAETLGYAFLGVTVPAIMLYGLNYLQDQYGGVPDDQKYENLPRWQKDNAYIFPSVEGVRLRLAYPFQFGLPFGGLTNRFLDHFQTDDPKAFDGWIKAQIGDVMPSVIPPIALPPLEAATNHNFFTGRPMIPGSLEKASGEMQYTPSTTEPAKALARVLSPRHMGDMSPDVSPITLENFVRGWTGTVGMAALKALNTPFSHSGAPWEVSDIPFVQSFVVRNPGMGAQPIQDYYDEAKKFETAHADLSLAMNRLKQGADTSELQQTSSDVRAMVQTTNITKAIQMQQSVIQGINDNKEMTAGEKRQATDRAYSDMITTAKFGLQVLRGISTAQTAVAGQ